MKFQGQILKRRIQGESAEEARHKYVFYNFCPFCGTNNEHNVGYRSRKNSVAWTDHCQSCGKDYAYSRVAERNDKYIFRYCESDNAPYPQLRAHGTTIQFLLYTTDRKEKYREIGS